MKLPELMKKTGMSRYLIGLRAEELASCGLRDGSRYKKETVAYLRENRWYTFNDLIAETGLSRYILKKKIPELTEKGHVIHVGEKKYFTKNVFAALSAKHGKKYLSLRVDRDAADIIRAKGQIWLNRVLEKSESLPASPDRREPAPKPRVCIYAGLTLDNYNRLNGMNVSATVEIVVLGSIQH